MSEMEHGGWSDEQLVDSEVAEICMKVKPQIEKMLNTTFEGYIPFSFKSQIVAGTNYAVKVVVGLDTCVHAMILAAPPCNGGKLTVNEAHYQKLSDPIVV
ncbi:leukocyte cysteine proteinase inhibitor 1-like [Pseudorasbora parva]|uniref:leukocyte cysteine proteinase inhibitor 1-like n=1 Tax=Pseudorasbora parva TaxID=51549 RepID=UPI00351F2F25